MLRCKLGDCIKEVVEKTTENNQYEVLSVTKDGIFSQEEFFKKQIASENNIGYKVIKKNNLVFSTMNLWMGSLDVLTNYEIGIVSPAYKIFEFDESKMLPEFAKYFMKSHIMLERYKDCSEQGASVVRRNLDLEQLLDTDISIPDIKAQEQIVRILDKADRIINSYDKLIKDKEQFIKSQFVEMFIKANYPRITLNEISSIKGEYGLSVSSRNYDENVGRYIRITDINDDGTLNDDYTSPMTNKNIDSYILKEGDILFARTGGTVGKTYKYRKTDGKCSYAGYCIRFRIDCEETNEDYIFAYTKTNEYKNWIKDRQRVGAQPNINSNEYGNELEIPLPPKEKQKEFLKLNQLIDKQKFNYIEKIKLLNKLKNIQGAKKYE